MSDFRKTPFVWGIGIAVFLFAYISCPPLLAWAFQGGEPPAPFNAIILIIFYPLQVLYDNAWWYRGYIDFIFKLFGV